MKLFLICSSITLMSCACIPKKNQPSWSPEIYAGSSAVGGFVRKQSNEEVSCLSPKIDDMVAMSYQDLTCMYFTYVDNCKAYKDPAPKCPTVNRSSVLKQIDYLNQYLKDHPDLQ